MAGTAAAARHPSPAPSAMGRPEGLALQGDSVPAPELLTRAHHFGRLGALSTVMAARFRFPIQAQVQVQPVGSRGAANLTRRTRSSCGSDR